MRVDRTEDLGVVTRRMIQFAEVFPDRQIISALQRQLSWTYFVALIPMNDPLQREFYAEMCRVERWSVRTLREKINGMLYERTAISGKPAELARQDLDSLRDCDRMTSDLVFSDVTRLSKRAEQSLKETAELGKFDCLST